MNVSELNFDENGLIPAVIQDIDSGKVLMLGYMNKESIALSFSSNFVTFYSRKRKSIWMKGESSGNKLQIVEMYVDCDSDTILCKVKPLGPVCHTGDVTCFHEQKSEGIQFLSDLEGVINNRLEQSSEGSYTRSLFERGIEKVAQKVGEEAVELVIEAMKNQDDLFLEEASDLLFHYLLLLKAKGYGLQDVVKTLEKRHIKKA